MNASEELPGFGESLVRFQERTKEEKRRLEEREELLNLLRKANEEIQELKKSRVTRDEIAEFLEKFLNEFSHVIDGIADTKTKGLFTGFKGNISKTVNALKEG